ncbi:hypothetical protein DQ04_18591000 [Trypanosoma grayi]|uniref:hypothetical protein n=1 Tax=Trypanosoma grayi TaxID=71804 RepID=UPI0004F4AD55|nr:hypothetical protein DQ04_18591000 [Trypanosoma grayi]KEG05769.1 hypothetical protein DQ04_18591000 [Trypanosoma grayi]
MTPGEIAVKVHALRVQDVGGVIVGGQNVEERRLVRRAVRVVRALEPHPQLPLVAQHFDDDATHPQQLHLHAAPLPVEVVGEHEVPHLRPLRVLPPAVPEDKRHIAVNDAQRDVLVLVKQVLYEDTAVQRGDEEAAQVHTRRRRQNEVAQEHLHRDAQQLVDVQHQYEPA